MNPVEILTVEDVKCADDILLAGYRSLVEIEIERQLEIGAEVLKVIEGLMRARCRVMDEQDGRVLLTRKRLPPVTTDKLAVVERDHVVAVLTACGGNKSRAAERLGLTRRSLLRRVNKLKSVKP
jgi:DNA-binding NtrC family response regulator